MLQFSSIMLGCSGRKEGVVSAVYRGDKELFESPVLILYLAMVVDAHNSRSSRGRVFYCKGNLAVPRKSLRSSKGKSKVYIRRVQYMQGGVLLT